MYDTRNYVQYFIKTCNGKESEKEYMYIHICIISLNWCRDEQIYAYIYSRTYSKNFSLGKDLVVGGKAI